MPDAADWREAIDRRLGALGVSPIRRAEIVEEVTAYLQDRCEELRSAGYTNADARRLALADLEPMRSHASSSRPKFAPRRTYRRWAPEGAPAWRP